MIKEHSVVVNNIPFLGYGIPLGTTGTVIWMSKDFALCEVEFIVDKKSICKTVITRFLDLKVDEKLMLFGNFDLRYNNLLDDVGRDMCARVHCHIMTENLVLNARFNTLRNSLFLKSQTSEIKYLGTCTWFNI